MPQENLIATMLQAIEEELMQQIYRRGNIIPASFLEMLTYHLGWTTSGESKEIKSGKRIRPLILLLITSACGHEWRTSLPAAASIELVHNFSLIHDDIQDESPTRRGRPAVWKKWGVPMAINAGDALFSLANLVLKDLSSVYRKKEILLSTLIVHSACLNLTIGQHLDMSSQENAAFSVEDYWVMIENKTASLFSACAELGALLGGANNSIIAYYKEFGKLIGLAFQIQDDYLGIWGSENVIGKSTTSDIENKKKSFPILYGLKKSREFSDSWKSCGQIPPNPKHLVSILENTDVKSITRSTISNYINLARETIQMADPKEPSRKELFKLLKDLEDREN